MSNSHKVVMKKLIGVLCILTIVISAVYTPIALAVKAADTVTVTFIDSLNNTESSVSGSKGDSFTYPADPVDQTEEKWFMGWFTDETYKTEHTDGLFGDEDLTLYAKWLSEYSSYSQDFENYTKDNYTVVTNAAGAKEKNNRQSFFDGAVKQSDITYNNSGYAVKIDWDAQMVRDVNDPSTYDANARWKSVDRKIELDIRPENEVLYKISFKYFVEKAETDFNFAFYSAQAGNIWTGQKSYGSIKGENKNEWTEASYEFTTNFNGGNKSIYVVLGITENKDVTVYIDDFKLEPVSQPYESNVVIKTGYGDDITLKGKRGEAFTLPQLVHPSDAEFLGYFADENFTKEFTATNYERKSLTVYAKWGAAPITFANGLPYELKPTERAYYTISVKNDKNVGFNDDYALNFLFDGDFSYQRPNDTEPQILYKRAGSPDNSAKIADVNNGSLYKVTYYRKSAENSQSDFSVTLMTANYSNIWASGQVLYSETKKTVKADETDWVKETIYFIPTIDVAASNSLFLSFNSLDKTENSYVNAYVDSVLVEELVGDVIYFDGNAEGVTAEVVSGKAGDTFTAPDIKNGKSKLLGWYTDAECTVPFTATTIPAGFTKVYAKWSAAPEAFEKLPYELTPNDRAYYTISVKNEKNLGYGDDYALQFLFDGDASYQRPNDSAPTILYKRAGIMDNCVRVGNVTNGVPYKISFYVKAGSDCQSDTLINLSTGEGSNIWLPGWISYNDTKASVKSTDTEWVYKELYFIPNITVTKATALYLQFVPTEFVENTYINMYVDDLLIEKFEENALCFVDNSSNSNFELIKGNVGDTFTAPVFKNGDREFLGWYCDAKCTVPFTATTIPAGLTMVYAKWSGADEQPDTPQTPVQPTPPVKQEAPFTFETLPFSLTVNDRAYYTLSAKEGKNLGYNDNYALQFLFDGDKSYQRPNDTEPTVLYKRAGSKDNSIRVGTIANGSLYKVSYYRKAGQNCQSDFSIVLATGNGSNIWSTGWVEYSNTRITVNSTEKDWQYEEIYILPNLTVSSANALYLQLNSLDLTENSYVEAYIDNVFVEEITDDAIYFDGNADGLYPQVVIGKAGDTFTAPVFKNGKSELLGWFTDADCTIPFTATTIPSGLTKVYAKWSVAPIVFERLPYELKTSDRAYYTISIKSGKDVGYGDDYALNFLFDGDKSYKRPNDAAPTVLYTRASSVDNSVKIGQVIDGALYKVSYYVRSGKNSKSDFSVVLTTGNGGNIFAPGRKEYGATKITVKANENKWEYKEFYISPTISVNGANSLFLQFNSLDATESSYVDAYVDDLMIAKIDAPYIFLDYTDAEKTEFIKGETGQKITLPTKATCFGKIFTGWYSDVECTTKFTQTHFTSDTAITVYAGWKDSSKVTYTFEKYNIPHRGENPSFNIRRDAHVKTNSKALSGNKLLEVDRTANQTHASYAAIAYDSKVHRIDNKKGYIVTINYYVAKKADAPMTVNLLNAQFNNYWGVQTKSSNFAISIDTEVGKWKQAILVMDGTKIDDAKVKSGGDGVFLEIVGGNGGIVYFDDITIETIPSGSSAVIIDNPGCKDIPTVLMGKPGQSFASKLPEAPKFGEKYFKGYYTIDENGNYLELARENMKFAKGPFMIYARFLNSQVTEDFESGAINTLLDSFPVFSIYDFDYELYDSTADGNSADNVTSGRYSLHRKGNTNFNENALILNRHNAIAEGERYTVTFKVKLGAHKHTNGAISIVSCRTYNYAWDTMGDYYPVVAIADLADGQWHEVSYTFNSVEEFVSLQTPGQVELFFDDFTFTIANDVPLSTPVEYTEHLIGVKAQSNGVDITTIIDESLLNNSVSIWLVIGIIAASVIVAAGIVLVIIKRKKA